MSGTVGVFVPMNGQKDTLVNYFNSNGVKYLGGIPVADEAPVDALLFEVEDMGRDFVNKNYIDETDFEIVDVDFLDEFEVDGVVVGWEVDYRVSEKMR